MPDPVAERQQVVDLPGGLVAEPAGSARERA